MLKGKRIVVDPGHGGRDTGAIGPTGLLEKDVNLRVALALKDLLEARGAQVFLTRKADEEVSLSERAEIIRELEPDLALSIHHNSTPEPFENRVEVYYPWVRWGPSVELAWLAARRLSEVLGLPFTKPLPAKYSVFKAGVEPFVLTEAGYIADPKEEKRLRTLQREIAEATALADAITEFLTRPRPWTCSATLRPGFVEVEGQGVDPLLSEARLDGRRLLPFLDGKGLKFRLPLLPNGVHIFEFLPRSQYGFSGAPLVKRFAVKRAPHSATAAVFPPEAPPGPVVALVSVSLFDKYGFPVPDGVAVRVEVLEPNEVKEFSGQTHGGQVSFLWETEAPGARLRVLTDAGFEALLSVRLPRRKDLAAITGSVSPPDAEPYPSLGQRYLQRKGPFFWFLGRGEVSATLRVWAPGYKVFTQEVELFPGSSKFVEVKLNLTKEGILRKRRVALYAARPEFDSLLAELEALLLSAGALVLRASSDKTQEEFAWEAQEWGAEILLAVFPGHRRRALHYHRDPRGAALAELVIGAARRELALDFEKGTTGRYIAIHPDGARLVLELQPSAELSGLAEAVFNAMVNYGIANFPKP